MEAPASIWCRPCGRGGQSGLPHGPGCRLWHPRSRLELLRPTAARAGGSALPALASARRHVSEAGEFGRSQRKTTSSEVQRVRAWRGTQVPGCWSRGAASQDRRAPARFSMGERGSLCAEMGHPSPATGGRRLRAPGGSRTDGPALEPAGEPRGSGRPTKAPVSRAAAQARGWESVTLDAPQGASPRPTPSR